MGEVKGPQMHQGGWTKKKGGGSRHSPPSQFPRIMLAKNLKTWQDLEKYGRNLKKEIQCDSLFTARSNL